MADRYAMKVETRGITLRGEFDIAQASATKQLSDAKAGLLRQLLAIDGIKLTWLGSVKEDGTICSDQNDQARSNLTNKNLYACEGGSVV